MGRGWMTGRKDGERRDEGENGWEEGGWGKEGVGVGRGEKGRGVILHVHDTKQLKLPK